MTATHATHLLPIFLEMGSANNHRFTNKLRECYPCYPSTSQLRVRVYIVPLGKGWEVMGSDG